MLAGHQYSCCSSYGVPDQSWRDQQLSPSQLRHAPTPPNFKHNQSINQPTNQPSFLPSFHGPTTKGHFTHEPRAVTWKLGEPKRKEKCPKAVPTHLQHHAVWSRTPKCSTLRHHQILNTINQPTNLHSFLGPTPEGHFTHEPRAVTMKLGEPKRKVPKGHPNTLPKFCGAVKDPRV